MESLRAKVVICSQIFTLIACGSVCFQPASASPSCLGYVHKRRELSGFFVKRFVEVRGGLLTWTKPETVSANTDVSCRSLVGAVVRVREDDAWLGDLGTNLFPFVVYLAYDNRATHVPPVIFACESADEREAWVASIGRASSWLYQRPFLQPLPQRLCGLLVIEIISIENILPADWNGRSDPYVQVTYNALRARTATQYKTLFATFCEKLTLPVYNDDPNLTIEILVMDQDRFRPDDVLGAVTLPLHALGFNKEIVWDSVALKPTKGSIQGRSAGTGDQYGSISFRSLYRSSKVTQFLPLRKSQTQHVELSASAFKERALPPAAQYTQTLRATLTSAKLASTMRHDDDDDDDVLDGKKPNPGSDGQSSPRSGPGSPKNQPEEEGETDFSIEMFKAQVKRIVAIIKVLSVLKAVGYFIAWRDPQWTLTLYVWASWVCLFEPQSALMFYIVFLLKLLLQAHPFYGEFRLELQDRWFSFSARVTDSVMFRTAKSGSGLASDSGLSPRSISLAATSSEYRVYECQRRKIAGALDMITTVMKAPAQMAVAAGAAVVSPALRSEDDKGPPHKSIANDVKKDLEDLFIHFSSENLRPREAEWVSVSGVPLTDSPATVIDGIKIKWSVFVSKKLTDKNGWEYAKAFPAPQAGDDSIEFDSKTGIWGAGTSTVFLPVMRMHKHWVRRRVWIGSPIRPAFDSEEPVRLAEIVAAVEHGSERVDEENKARSLLARFKQLMEEGRKLQNVIFRIASRLESIKNLTSWKARWISSLVFYLLLVVLVLCLVMSQFVVVWLLLTFVVTDNLVDTFKKRALTRPLLDMIREQIQESTVPVQWRKLLRARLSSHFSTLESVTADVPGQVLLSIFQKACDKLWFPNAVLLSLHDVEPHSDGGPVTLGMVLELAYQQINNNDADWWKTEKSFVHPKNLMNGHLVSDWEEYNPSSIFAK